MTAKRWLGVWLGVRGPVKAPPSLCAMRDVGKSRAQIHEDADQHGHDARRLRRAITDEGRNLVGDKKEARVDENGYVRSTDRIWKGLGEGRSAATELRGQAGGLRRRRPARGDGRRSRTEVTAGVPRSCASDEREQTGRTSALKQQMGEHFTLLARNVAIEGRRCTVW